MFVPAALIGHIFIRLVLGPSFWIFTIVAVFWFPWSKIVELFGGIDRRNETA